MEKREDGYFFTNEEVARGLKLAGIIGSSLLVAKLMAIALSPAIVYCK